MIAIDGKTARGARSKTTCAPHLIAALDHATGAVLGQRAAAAKSNEIPAVRDLLAGFDAADLRGCVITVDAVHTRDQTAATITDAGADYVFTVKADRPTLWKALKAPPWNKVPVGSQSTRHSRGRRVTRTIKVIQAPTLAGRPTFTGATQIAQPRRTVTREGKKTVEAVHPDHLRNPPRRTTSRTRGPGPEPPGIENRLHRVRDVTHDEDRSQICTGTTPRIMATLRNTVITILRLAGWTNIAAALRHHSRDSERAITCALTC